MSNNLNVVPAGTEIPLAPGISTVATPGVAMIDMATGKVTTAGKAEPEKKPWRTELNELEKSLLKKMMIRATSPFPIGQPYMTPVFFRLIPVSAPGLNTLAVTHDWHLLIDFDFIFKMGKEKGDMVALEWAGGVLGHEPWHLLRDAKGERFLRVDGEGYQRSHDLWNMAMDMEINDDIVDIIPDDGCVAGNGKFADYDLYQTAEHYYHLLLNDPNITRKEDGDGDGEPSDESGNGQGQGSGQGGQPGQGNGKGQGSGQGGQPGQGQQARGNGSKVEVMKPEDTTICGGTDVQDDLKKQMQENGIEEGLNPVDAEMTIRELATRIKNSKMSVGTDRGARAAVQWAEDYLLEEPVNWRRELRATLSMTVSSAKRGLMDYSYKRQARRQPYKGVIMPGMVEPKIRLICGIDTSGSNVPNMGIIVDEIVKISQQLSIRGQDFSAFAVDVDVDSLTPVKNPREVLKGRRMNGGTQMGPAYRFVAGLRGQKKPNVFLLITDGEVFDGDLPSEQPKGMNGTAVVTALVLNGKPNEAHNEQIVAKAKAALSSWSKVICLYNVGEDAA